MKNMSESTVGCSVKRSSVRKLTQVSEMTWERVEGGLYCCIENQMVDGDDEPEFQDFSAINLSDDDVINFRDWLLTEYPLSKQELVDLMGGVVRGDKQ